MPQTVMFDGVRTAEEKAARLAELGDARFTVVYPSFDGVTVNVYRFVGLEPANGPWAAALRLSDDNGDVFICANSEMLGVTLVADE